PESDEIMSLWKENKSVLMSFSKQCFKNNHSVLNFFGHCNDIDHEKQKYTAEISELYCSWATVYQQGRLVDS
uniref:Uncharacterized protein n=1 Tax=Nothoprocta perdicaria TaxID=30464 RepID=A0A8C6YYJ3_NOTPE